MFSLYQQVERRCCIRLPFEDLGVFGAGGEVIGDHAFEVEKGLGSGS
jgi:hypothetical protein